MTIAENVEEAFGNDGGAQRQVGFGTQTHLDSSCLPELQAEYDNR